MSEVWKDIPEFDQYEVSDLGNVRNKKSQRVMIKFQSDSGYQRITLRCNKKYVTRDVHRLVALAFLPNPEGKATVNHKNRVKNDNRLENLEWATQREQILHARQETYTDQYSVSSYVPEVDEAEEWRPTQHKNYNVSNKGSIKNIVTCTIRAITVDGRGYCYTSFGTRTMSVHRVVARAFLANFTDECVINHKDGNKSNNNVHNLECVSQSRNILHAYAGGASMNKTKLVPVLQVNHLGVIIGSFPSLADAETSSGVNRGSIHGSIHNGTASHGYMWYTCLEDYEKDKCNIPDKIFKVFQYTQAGDLIGTFDDFRVAEEHTGVVHYNISSAVNNFKDRLRSSGGYIWTTSRVPKTELLNELRQDASVLNRGLDEKNIQLRKVDGQTIIRVLKKHHANPKMTQEELGAEFGVSRQYISRILHGKGTVMKECEFPCEGVTWDEYNAMLVV